LDKEAKGNARGEWEELHQYLPPSTSVKEKACGDKRGMKTLGDMHKYSSP